MRRVRNMQFSDDCRSHALVLIEIANESPKYKEQALALAERWPTLANIHNRFCSNPSYSACRRGCEIASSAFRVRSAGSGSPKVVDLMLVYEAGDLSP